MISKCMMLITIQAWSYDIGSYDITQAITVYVRNSKMEKLERSGSVVESLTRYRWAAGSSLIGITALWSLSKTHLSQLSTGSTQEDPSLYN